MVKRSIRCISLLFIGCGISYFCLDNYKLTIDKIENKNIINNFLYGNNNFEAILEIPDIKFKRGLYKKDDIKSNIDKNIIFLDSSDMPDVDNSRVIIVGHSGAPSNAYFKDLFKLKLNSYIYMYYKNIKYTYKVTDKYEIKKNGTLALESNKNDKTLTLVTCKGLDKQLVIISTLIKEKLI